MVKQEEILMDSLVMMVEDVLELVAAVEVISWSNYGSLVTEQES